MRPLGELPASPERGWVHYPGNMLRSWQSLVESTTWMPDTRLSVAEEMGEIVLRVRLKTKDSFNPTQDAVIGHRHRLMSSYEERPMQPEQMEGLLRSRLQQVAAHEADEWIVIGRRRPFNPHRER